MQSVGAPISLPWGSKSGNADLAGIASPSDAVPVEDGEWDLAAPFSPRAVELLVPGVTLDGTSGVSPPSP